MQDDLSDNFSVAQGQAPSGRARKGERLSRLSRAPGEKRVHNPRYSSIIRSLKIALPLAALAIVAILFSWDFLNSDQIIAASPTNNTSSIIGKNELLNPKFDSVDDKGQPYTITADRAIQDSGDELMILEAPMADIALNSGNWLALKARQGAFRQESQRLLLKDDVTLFHDDGYTVVTQELNINMKEGQADTDLNISGHGPLGTLDASGMRADSKGETLLFKGPAKIVLYETGKSGTRILNP